MINPSIYSFIKTEEADYESDEVQLGDNWSWNMRDHIQLLFHLKNSIFYTGENDWMRAFKNIMEPMLNLSYWTEDLEVKDTVFFIESERGRALSFLVKKYHDEVFSREYNLDTLFDELTESDLDYGGVLVQKTNGPRPEVIPLNSIAFCDQTDIMGGPIGFKYHFSPDALRKMEKNGWGSEANGANISIDELITLAESNKDSDGTKETKSNEVPGKTIEVYIVRGSLPEHYLKDNDNMDVWYNQVHIVGFYTDKNHKQHGVTLYRKKETDESIKFFTSKKVHGRGLGRGVGEMLLHSQIWTNFLTIHKTKMLEAASKTLLQTDDPAFQNRNHIQDMDNLEIATLDEGKQIRQIPTAATANIQLFENSINEWFEQAQSEAAAYDPMLGKEAVSGTTFRGQERTVAQGRGLHDRRRGQRAKFIEELYREWIVPYIVKQILKGQKFIATLSNAELNWVADQLATTAANKEIKKRMMKMDLTQPLPTQEEINLLKAEFKKKFLKKGDKHILQILKGEFEGIELNIGINIANKQKDLVNLSDKILSIFQYVFQNPQAFQQAMQIPALSKAFQDILEFSGMNQSDFMSLVQAPVTTPELPQQPPQPMQFNAQQEQTV